MSKKLHTCQECGKEVETHKIVWVHDGETGSSKLVCKECEHGGN